MEYWKRTYSQSLEQDLTLTLREFVEILIQKQNFNAQMKKPIKKKKTRVIKLRVKLRKHMIL